MRRRCITLLLALFTLLGLPSNAAFAGEVQPMGRYMESEVQMPDDAFKLLKLLPSEPGDGLTALCLALGEDTGLLARYGWDGQTWLRVDAAPGELNFSDVAWRDDNLYYMTYVDAEDGVYQQLERFKDGVWEIVPADYGGGFPTKLDIVEDGSLLVQCAEGSILVLDGESGARLMQYDGLDGAFIPAGNGFFAIAGADRTVRQYELGGAEPIRTFADAPLGGSNAMGFDGEAVYLANSTGIYRIALNGSIWEQLVDGNLTSLRLPGTTLDDIARVDDKFYVLAQRDFETHLFCYQYDADAGARPAHQIDAYTLYEDAVLTQAASIWQAQHPDYIVNITVLLPEGTGATADEVIRSLNTKLLAGEGPDVLLLNGLPMGSYIEKGVLCDLSPLIDDMNKAGELVWPLFEPLLQDGRIYVVPTSCTLPAIMSKDAGLLNVNTLEDLAAMIERSDSRSPILWRKKQDYFAMFLPAGYPAWFGEGGHLDERAFTRYLEAIDRIYLRAGVDVSEPNQKAYLETIEAWSADNLDPMGGKGAMVPELPRLEDGRTLVYPFILRGFSEGMIHLTKLDETGAVLTWLPGEAERVYAPGSILGVNARSEQLDAAVEFVRVALSQQVQDVSADGNLPVNRKSLDMYVKNDGRGTYGWGAHDPETGEELNNLVGFWPKLKQRELVGAMLTDASTPYIPDDTLIAMIKTELAPWFDGEMDARAATAMVSAKVRAYLAE